MSADLTGRLLGGCYRVQRSIGEGGMGGVWEATQEGLGRRVAIKVISEQLADEPVYLERFRREASAAAQLGHPNIVQVTDFQHLPGEAPLIVMELLEGEPLSRRLKERGRLPPALAVQIAREVVAGLEVAHTHGIVHRDLKPANVFLVPMPGGRVLTKIVDFGIAKLMDSNTYHRLTRTGVLVGTPRYAAPEQLRDGHAADARTDVYAAGNLLYCMLAGQPPFSTHAAQLMIEIQSAPPPPLRTLVPTLDPGLAAVVERAMQKSPEHRWQSATELARALEPYAGGGTNVEARPLAGTAPMTAGGAVLSAPPAATPAPATPPPQTRPRVQATALLLQTPSPTYVVPRAAPPPPSTDRATIVLTALGVVLLALVLVLSAGVAYLALRPANEAHDPTEDGVDVAVDEGPGVVRAVPQACLEWERYACTQCNNNDARDQYCPMAQATLVAYADGDTAEPDCDGLLSAIRQACSMPN